MITQQEFQVNLQPIQQKYVKIQILNWNEDVIDEIQGKCLSGNINIDATQIVRRSLDITLVLNDTKILPSPTSIIWLNKKIKVFIGIKDVITNDIVWFDKGIYILLKPSLKYSDSENTLSLQALDKMCWHNGQLNGKLQNITKINADTPLFQAIKTTIQQLGGENKIIIDDLLDDNNNELLIPYDIEKSADETITDILTEIRDLYMYYEYFYDESGRFHYSRITERKDDPIDFDFNEYPIVINYTNEPNWENVKNDITIWGATLEDGTQIKYHIENTDSTNPFNIDNIGRRKWTVSDDKIFTQSQAEIRGEYELWQHSTLQEEINFSCVPLYFLDVNKKIKVDNKETNISGEYLIDKISFDLSDSGEMSVTAHKLYYGN